MLHLNSLILFATKIVQTFLKPTQVHQRCDEVRRVLDVLERINDGDDVENVLNVDNKTSNVTLSDFKDSLDLTQPILCGENKIASQTKVK